MSSAKLPPGLSRRTLLKSGLVGFVLVSAGSAALLLQKPKPHESANLTVLTSDEASVLAALADRLCPALGAGAPGALALGIVNQVDLMLQAADADAQRGIKVGLLLFDNALTGALSGERVRPFSQLSAADQDAQIRSWQQSRVGFKRTLIRALSSLVMSLYWAAPETWPRIGYGGPPSPEGLRSAYAENLVDLGALAARPAKEI